MELLACVIRDAIPSYLKNVPIPRSFRGFGSLSLKDWVHLIAFSAVTGGAGYIALKPYYERYYGKCGDTVVNLTVSKEKDKVVDFVEIEDLGEKTCFCRCWRSKKFPYCDGSHYEHNQATGDNVGPMVVQRKQESG